jgi:hypothetical protein
VDEAVDVAFADNDDDAEGQRVTLGEPDVEGQGEALPDDEDPAEPVLDDEGQELTVGDKERDCVTVGDADSDTERVEVTDKEALPVPDSVREVVAVTVGEVGGERVADAHALLEREPELDMVTVVHALLEADCDGDGVPVLLAEEERLVLVLCVALRHWVGVEDTQDVVEPVRDTELLEDAVPQGEAEWDCERVFAAVGEIDTEADTEGHEVTLAVWHEEPDTLGLRVPVPESVMERVEEGVADCVPEALIEPEAEAHVEAERDAETQPVADPDEVGHRL